MKPTINFIALYACIFLNLAHAQTEPNTVAELAQAEQQSSTEETTNEAIVDDYLVPKRNDREVVLQLREIQESLDSKAEKRKEIRKEIKEAGDDIPEALTADLAQINSEIELLERTYEQLAIGGIDLSVLGVEQQAFDWQEELITIVKPLIENVKGLTEKPRKMESLRQVIVEKELAQEASRKALISIQDLKISAENPEVLAKLIDIENDWTSRQEDIGRAIQLARFQLDSLEGKDVRWGAVVKKGLSDFLNGRGLTLLFVVLVIIAVSFFMRGILWLIQKRTKATQDKSTKMHFRLAAYGYRLLTVLLITIAIMMVLYFRQDMLLLAIMVIVVIGSALALKNLLPQYITEGRLLLNIGGIREQERVFYNGIPWRVNAVNMYSDFTNPEIRGAIRIPLSQMHEMISRPSVTEAWFPSSEGDWVLDSNDDLYRVMRQSVDVVELRNTDLVIRLMPTSDYFAAGYTNLSRAKIFRVSIQFGIDYATQTEDVDKIETAFCEGMKKSFADRPYNDDLVEVRVEFHSAGDSSLNYKLIAKFKPDCAEHHNRIKRRMQRACVMTCNENNWGIPFPQVSVHLPTAGDPEKTVDAKE